MIHPELFCEREQFTMAAESISMAAQLKEEMRSLMERMREIEQQIEQTVAALEAPGLGGLRGSLVDSEGFPRADVDVHGTRTLRNQHARLDTDHKALMALIESKLAAIYALPPEARSASSAPKRQAGDVAATAPPADPAPSSALPTAQPGAQSGDVDMAALEDDAGEPFAIVDEIAAGGPAEASGLRIGDLLLRFGQVDAQTQEPLGAVARAVGAAEASAADVALVVRRRAAAAAGVADVVRLTLTPRRWAGRGLLGCHLSPVRVNVG